MPREPRVKLEIICSHVVQVHVELKTIFRTLVQFVMISKTTYMCMPTPHWFLFSILGLQAYNLLYEQRTRHS